MIPSAYSRLAPTNLCARWHPIPLWIESVTVTSQWRPKCLHLRTRVAILGTAKEVPRHYLSKNYHNLKTRTDLTRRSVDIFQSKQNVNSIYFLKQSQNAWLHIFFCAVLCIQLYSELVYPIFYQFCPALRLHKVFHGSN